MAEGLVAEGEEAQVGEVVETLTPYEDAVLLAALKQVLEERPSVVQELADWAIPDRAYASARLLQENRLSGTIKSFSESTGYGFIDCPEVKAAFGNDVFLHFSQVAGFGVGQEVSFAILVNKERKPQAFDLGPVQNGKDMRLQKGAGGAQKGGKAGPPAGGKIGPSAKGPPLWMPSEKGCWGSWKGDQAWNGMAGKGKDPWGWMESQYDDGSFGKAKGKGPMFPGPCAKGGGGCKGFAVQGKGGKPAADPPESAVEMEGVTDRRFEGTVKSFNEQKGFGFIYCDEIMEKFGGDAFLHHRQFKGFEVNQAVSFEVFLNKDGKPQAKELRPIGGEDEPFAKRLKMA